MTEPYRTQFATAAVRARIGFSQPDGDPLVRQNRAIPSPAPNLLVKGYDGWHRTVSNRLNLDSSVEWNAVRVAILTNY